MTKTATAEYSGDIVAGSLLVPESRQIARLLLEKDTQEAWHQAIVIDNILQKRSPATAKRQARLIKARLSLMQPDFWEMIVTGSSDVATQAVLAAAIKQSRLLGDFMNTVIRQHWQTFEPRISERDWKDYLKSCAQIDPGVDQWSESTRAKLKQVVFRMLAESGYINSTRFLNLLPVSMIPEVRNYLIDHKEAAVLRCMEVTP